VLFSGTLYRDLIFKRLDGSLSITSHMPFYKKHLKNEMFFCTSPFPPAIGHKCFLASLHHYYEKAQPSHKCILFQKKETIKLIDKNIKNIIIKI